MLAMDPMTARMTEHSILSKSIAFEVRFGDFDLDLVRFVTRVPPFNGFLEPAGFTHNAEHTNFRRTEVSFVEIHHD